MKQRKRKGFLHDQEFEDNPDTKIKKEQPNKNLEEIGIDKGKEKAFTATLCYKLKNKASSHSIQEFPERQGLLK